MPKHLLLPLAWVLLLAGCGSGSYEIAPVSGRVTLDGEPLKGCQVRFQPVAASESNVAPGPGAFAVTDEQGRFTLRTIEPVRPGAVVGAHRVWLTTVNEEDMQSESWRVTAEKVPPPYRNGQLEFDVPPNGTEEADFELTSQ